MYRRIRAFAAVAAAGALLAVGSAQAASTEPALAWSGTSNFGTVDGVGGQTATQTFTLTNSGGSATGTLTVTLTNTSGTAFSITSDGCTGRSLGPKKSCTVTVEYAPITSGESDSVTLTATGEHASATIVLTGASGAPDLTLSPGTLHCTSACLHAYDFGLVSAGSSKTQTFTVTNGGTGTSETLQLLLDNHPQFATTNDKCSGGALAPNGTCTFDETYTSPAGCSGEPFLSGPITVLGEPTFVDYIDMVATGECP